MKSNRTILKYCWFLLTNLRQLVKNSTPTHYFNSSGAIERGTAGSSKVGMLECSSNIGHKNIKYQLCIASCDEVWRSKFKIRVFCDRYAFQNISLYHEYLITKMPCIVSKRISKVSTLTEVCMCCLSYTAPMGCFKIHIHIMTQLRDYWTHFRNVVMYR